MDQSLHQKSGKSRWLSVLLIVAPATLASILMLIAYLTQYDGPEANYFRLGAPLPMIAALFASLTVIAGTVLAVRLPISTDSLRLSSTTRASAVSAAGFLICAALQSVVASETGVKWYFIVTLILLLLSICYFIFSIRNPDSEPAHDLLILLGIAPVFSLIFLCAIHYFDKSVEMNAPVKATVLLGLLTAILTVTGDIRRLIGTAHPRIELVLWSCSLAAGALVFPAVPVAFFTGALEKSAYLASSFAVLGCSVASGIRIVDSLRHADSETEVTQS